MLRKNGKGKPLFIFVTLCLQFFKKNFWHVVTSAGKMLRWLGFSKMWRKLSFVINTWRSTKENEVGEWVFFACLPQNSRSPPSNFGGWFMYGQSDNLSWENFCRGAGVFVEGISGEDILCGVVVAGELQVGVFFSLRKRWEISVNLLLSLAANCTETSFSKSSEK